MINRILAVAENGWKELERKKVLFILVAAILFGFLGPIYIQSRWLISAGVGYRGMLALQETILSLDKIILFIGLSSSILLGAGSTESEVSKRTLCSVMIRPIHRWEYLAGRGLSLLFFYFLFALAAVLCSYGAAALLGGSLPEVFLWGILQRFGSGATWIIIALSLGAIASSQSAVVLIVLVGIFSIFAPHLSNEIHWMVPAFKKIFHYAMPCSWMTDFLTAETVRGDNEQSLLLNAAVLAENLMYGIVVFLGCSWLFTRRDLKLRE